MKMERVYIAQQNIWEIILTENVCSYLKNKNEKVNTKSTFALYNCITFD